MLITLNMPEQNIQTTLLCRYAETVTISYTSKDVEVSFGSTKA